jgi:hypothetical protein
MSVSRRIKSAQSIEPGLVLWLPFDGDIRDYSGNSNHGINYGANWSNDSIGKSLMFNGIDNYLQILSSNSLGLSNAIGSVSCQIKTTVSGVQRDILVKGTTTWWLLRLRTDGVVRVQLYDGATQLKRDSTKIVNDGKWHLVTSTFRNGESCYLYIDGKRSDGNATINTINSIANTDSVLIANGVLSGGYLSANIKNVRIYNRDLNSMEVWDLYQREL